MGTVEDVQDEVERILRRCPEMIVREVGEEWKIEGMEGKTKRVLIRMMQDMLDGLEDNEEKIQLFIRAVPLLPDNWKQKLSNLLKDPNDDGGNQGEGPEVEVNGNVEEDSMGQSLNDNQNTSRVLEDDKTSMTLIKFLEMQTGTTSAFRRECRISGIIDDNKRVNYISLCKEVSEAKRKGFKYYEIVGAIRKAIPTGELRTYLDSFPDISLENTLTLIRSAYKEKSATELFQELDKLCQRRDEDGPQFLFRALSIRQRILKASEVEGEVHYHRPQVAAVFMHSVRTGLLHEPIRTHMVPFLDVHRDLPDAVLMAEMNKAQDEFNERISKRQDVSDPSKVKARVNEATASNNSDRLMQQLVNQMSAMLTEMKQMKEEVKTSSDVRPRDVASDKKNQRQSQTRPRGCTTCQEKNVGDSCTHCWKCGGDYHHSRHCQKKSSNRSGLRE